MINKYRYVRYTDDGCAIFECLACKGDWEVRSIPHVFCPSCGIKFLGQVEWDECEKSKKYWNSDYKYSAPKSFKKCFQILSRYKFGTNDSEWSNWECAQDFNHKSGIEAAKEALINLKNLQEFERLEDATLFSMMICEYKIVYEELHKYEKKYRYIDERDIENQRKELQERLRYLNEKEQEENF